MRRFLLYLISVTTPVVIYLGAGEYMARQVPNSYRYKEIWMEQNKDVVETLVMGGSHTYYGVKPSLLDGKAFNLANLAQGLRHDYFLLKKFDCPKLKTIIIPISYPTLFDGDLEDGLEWYRQIFYKLYMDYPAHSDFSKYNFEFMNAYTFKEKIKTYIKRQLGEKVYNDYDSLGWGQGFILSKKNMRKWNNNIEARAAAKRHTYESWGLALRNAAVNIELLTEIASECQNRNVNLIIVTTPCWHSYVELLKKKQLDKTKEIIKMLQLKYGIVYFDYLNDKRFKADDFFDSDHLSNIGAVKFSKILNSDIDNAVNHGIIQ